MLQVLTLVICGLGVGIVATIVSRTRDRAEVGRMLATAVLGALIGGGIGALIGLRAPFILAIASAMFFVWRGNPRRWGAA